MKTRNLLASVSLVAGNGPAEPPARVRIWRPGSNPGDYGELAFTRRAADSIMAAFATRGTLLAIDFEHNQNPKANPRLDPNAPPVTGGYLALEVVETRRGPELWFVPQWSDCGAPHAQAGTVCCAKHQITSRQRLYISPDWEMDLETREPLELNRVSLVAEPATYGVNLLASRANPGDRRTMNEAQLRAAFGLAKMQAEGADGDMKAAAAAFVEQLRQAAKNLGVDLDKGGGEAAPASVEASTQTATDPAAAAAATQMASADCAPDKNALASRGAGRMPTQAEIDRMHADAVSKVDLLAANKDRLTPKLSSMLASRSLAETREFLEALPSRAAGSEGTGGDVSGAVGLGPMRAAQGAKRALSAQDNFTASRIRGALGVTDKAAEEAEKAIDPDGGYTFSLSQIIETKQVERTARR